MSKIVTLVLACLSLSTFAAEKPKSLMCPDEKLVTVSGISCCTLRITAEKCESLVKSLDSNVLDLVAETQKDINEKKYKYRMAPNCHWTAMAYHSKDLAAKPEILDFTELEELLKANFTRVDKAKRGDVVVLQAYVTELVYKDEQEPRYRWSYDFPDHSAIYLGENFLFQKENNDSPTFSIDTISAASDVYKRWQGGGRIIQKDIRVRFYRANQ